MKDFELDNEMIKKQNMLRTLADAMDGYYSKWCEDCKKSNEIEWKYARTIRRGLYEYFKEIGELNEQEVEYEKKMK